MSTNPPPFSFAPPAFLPLPSGHSPPVLPPVLPLPSPSIASSSLAPPSTTTDKPAPKPPLNSLLPPSTGPPPSSIAEFLARANTGLDTLIGNGNIDARPSRQGLPPPKVGSCTSCRASKSKCSGGAVCERCIAGGTPCEYPVFAKRGRKRALTPNMILLEAIQKDVEQAMELLSRRDRSPGRRSNSSLSPPAHRLTPIASSSAVQNQDESDGEATGLETVIESPLAILAHISSLKISESTEEESGNTLSLLPTEKKDSTPADSYFSTGLYQARTDREPMLDPVNIGILTEQDLTRLVGVYFVHLHQFCWHLSPSLHSPKFLRDTSPFLTTALAYAAAGFCPLSQHLIQPLHAHAMFLSDRVFSEGHKSCEIVQAYCLLVHWAPIESNWGEDRRWGWLGQAMRIATEILLNKTLTESTFQFYRTVSVLPQNAYQTIVEDRAKSWTLLFIAEIALCVSTGRLGAIQGLNLVGGFRSRVPPCEVGHPNYNLCAMEELNRIYAKALALSAGLKEEAASSDGAGLREAFNASWSHDMQDWAQNWPGVNGYVRLVHQHNCTILLSVSLRFKGPVRPILEECRASALVTARLAAEWPDNSLAYGSNVLVVNIAYAATLLLRIENQMTPPAQQDAELRQLCRKVADVLERMGNLRPSTRTLSTLHCTRIRTLLAASERQRQGQLANEIRAPLVMPSIFHNHPTAVATNFFSPSAVPLPTGNAEDMFGIYSGGPMPIFPDVTVGATAGWPMSTPQDGAMKEWQATEPGTWAW